LTSAMAFGCLPSWGAMGASAQASRTAAAWAVEGASVAFVIRNAGLPVRGTIGGLDADVRFDPAHPEGGSLRGSLDPSAIETGIALRDRHLRGREYFHVDRYGRMDLRSIRLWRDGDQFRGAFFLRIRDVLREVEIPFTFEQEGPQARLAGALVIDRLDYGIGKESLILSDEVRVEVEVALRAGRPPPASGGR